MFFSRIWFLLITLLAIVLIVAFYLAPRPAEYRLDESLEKQLDVAQGLVHIHMQMQARKRLDVLSNMGKEPKIAKPLLTIQNPPKKGINTDAVLKNLKKALADANKKSGFNAETIALTDRKGRVRARLGAGGKINDSLANLPEIKQALRGVCLDNTVWRGGTLYWVYACPARYVKEGDKIKKAGAIRAEVSIDKSFVNSLASLLGEATSDGGNEEKGEKEKKKKKKKESLELEICFFANGNPVAWTKKTEIWAKHGPGLYKKYKKMLADKTIGRTPAEVVMKNKEKYLMVLGRLPGSASGNGTFWAILWKFPAALGPLAFSSGQTPRSHLLKGFPYVWVILGGVFGVLIGMFLLIWEGDLPAGRLLKQARALAADETEKIDDTKFRGKFSLAAIALNEALEKAAEKGSGKPALHDKDLNEVLGEIEPRMAEDDYAPPPPTAVADSSGDKEEPAPLGSVLPPQKQPQEKKSPPETPPSSPPPFGGQKGIRPATMSEQPPSSSKAFGGESSVGSGGAPPTPSSDVTPPDVEAHFKEVFNAFVSKKQECGENVSSLTYESFRKQLTRSRKQIMDTQSCKDVKFEVYEKGGKAALKAQPIKT